MDSDSLVRVALALRNRGYWGPKTVALVSVPCHVRKRLHTGGGVPPFFTTIFRPHPSKTLGVCLAQRRQRLHSRLVSQSSKTKSNAKSRRRFKAAKDQRRTYARVTPSHRKKCPTKNITLLHRSVGHSWDLDLGGPDWYLFNPIPLRSKIRHGGEQAVENRQQWCPLVSSFTTGSEVFRS